MAGPWVRLLSRPVKRAALGLTRRIGYDMVPLGQGFSGLQEQLLAKVDLVLDVGANVGQYAERMRALGYAGRIISFEPQSGAYAFLQRRTENDALWEARRVAIGRVTGEFDLYVSQNSVSSSLLTVLDEHLSAAREARIVSRESVLVNTLDDELRETHVGQCWLKLDIQGHELEALKGSSSILKQCSVVQIEVSFSQLYAGQSPWLDICTWLVERGFTLRHMEPGFEDPNTGVLQQADLLFARGH